MIQQQHKTDSPELPYLTLKFVYSGTIGNKQANSKEILIYDFNNKDILVPRVLNHYNHVYYLLFHTPSIYNWIRSIQCRQSELLNQYITGKANSVKKDEKMSTESAVIQSVSQILFKRSLDEYITKWEIAKLSFSSKLFIKNVKGQSCTIISKTQVYSHQVKYFPHLKSLQFTQYFCKQCNTTHEIQSQIKDLSNFIILYEDISQKTLYVELGIETLVYNMYLLMTSEAIYIKCSNKIWYEINMKDKMAKPIGIDKINLRNSLVAAYSRLKDDGSALLMAKPLGNIKKINVSQIKTTQAQEKIKILAEQDQIKEQNDKIYKSTAKRQQTSAVPLKKKKQLKELSFKPNQVIIKETEKVGQKYMEEVSKHFLQPKRKDQYEFNYDKGKMKKIKQKRTYIRPDFNEIHKRNLQKLATPQVDADKTKKIKKKFHHKRENLS